jgi:hypothetical protein
MTECRGLHAKLARGAALAFHDPVRFLQGAEDVFALHTVEITLAFVLAIATTVVRYGRGRLWV